MSRPYLGSPRACGTQIIFLDQPRCEPRAVRKGPALKRKCYKGEHAGNMLSSCMRSKITKIASNLKQPSFIRHKSWTLVNGLNGRTHTGCFEVGASLMFTWHFCWIDSENTKDIVPPLRHIIKAPSNPVPPKGFQGAKTAKVSYCKAINQKSAWHMRMGLFWLFPHSHDFAWPKTFFSFTRWNK